MSENNNMKCPVRRLLKRDLVWLGENKCRHSHTYLSHYTCFLAESPDTAPLVEKIGIFDIETTGLKANWSHMLCWRMKKQGEDVIFGDVVTTKEARDKNDTRIVKSAIAEFKKYDRIIGYYSSGFDIPYLRSRALEQGIDIPGYKDLYTTDMYFVCRSKFRIHSNRLGAICEFFGIEAKNHPMTPKLWKRAGAGEKDALEEICTHCTEDVESTDKVYQMLLKHMLVSKRSI